MEGAHGGTKPFTSWLEEKKRRLGCHYPLWEHKDLKSTCLDPLPKVSPPPNSATLGPNFAAWTFQGHLGTKPQQYLSKSQDFCLALKTTF
jgi:hypothetical protein